MPRNSQDLRVWLQVASHRSWSSTHIHLRITYGVYYEGEQPRIILAVYGDRMFVGEWLRDPAEKDVLVVVRPVSDLGGKTIETYAVGPLNPGVVSTRPPPDQGWDDPP